MRIHELKCREDFFEAAISGNKTFSVRCNDRDYAVGDVLAVNEVADSGYTGRCCLLKVTYILDDPAFCKSGFVILGFRPCELREKNLSVDPGTAGCFTLLTHPVYEVPCYTEV